MIWAVVHSDVSGYQPETQELNGIRLGICHT